MKIGNFQGISTDSVIIIKDPLTSSNKAGHHMGYLRSLPFLNTQDVMRYTFPPGWLRRQCPATFDEVLLRINEEEPVFRYQALEEFPFEYVIIGDEQSPSEITYKNLCQITSQAIDNYGDEGTTHKLLRAYLDGRIDEFILVTDKSTFSIEGTQSTKPLMEELDHPVIYSYKKLAKEYIRSEIGRPRISLGKTLNIWLHHAAVEFEELCGSKPNRIGDLFKFDVLPSGIRTWDLFEFLATSVAKEEIDHINATVRPWVEEDITKVEGNIRNALQEFNYDRGLVRTFRQTGERPN